MTEITFTGWNEFRNKLVTLPDIVFDEIDGECEAAIREWEEMAVAGAPVDTGLLRGGIRHKNVSLMHWELTSRAEYSASREWGTGNLVAVPVELQEYAIKFKGKGIRLVNSRPTPYFFPPKPIVERNLNQQIKRILTTEH